MKQRIRLANARWQRRRDLPVSFRSPTSWAWARRFGQYSF